MVRPIRPLSCSTRSRSPNIFPKWKLNECSAIFTGWMPFMSHNQQHQSNLRSKKTKLLGLFYAYYTLCSKKHVTAFSMTRWTRTVHLQRFLAHLLLRPSTGIFSFPPHLFSAATLPWGNCRDLNVINLTLNCWFSQCYNTRILTAKGL